MNKQKGIALVYCLIVSVLLLVSASLVVFKMKKMLSITSDVVVYEQTENKIKDIASSVIFAVITNSDVFYEGQWHKWQNDGTPLEFDSGLKVEVRDVAGMLSIAPFDYLTFEQLILNTSNTPVIKSSIIASIRDWIDQDAFVRLNGFEKISYKVSPIISPRNAPMLHFSELSLINNMDLALLNSLKSLFTPISDYDGVELKSSRELNTLLEKDYIPWRSPLVTDTSKLSFQSQFADVKISVATDDIERELHFVIDMDRSKDYPYAIVHWESS